MAARRAASRDRADVPDQRALARLNVEVRETLRWLIVTMPGTGYAMEFAQTDCSSWSVALAGMTQGRL